MKFDLEKMMDKVIHCNTKEKAENLLEFLDSQGFNWRGYICRLANNTFWETYDVDTCYRIIKEENGCKNQVTRGSLEYFKNYNLEYKVLEFEDVITSEEVVKSKPRICEVLGVELGEKFNIKGIANNPCVINTYHVMDSNNEILDVKAFDKSNKRT